MLPFFLVIFLVTFERLRAIFVGDYGWMGVRGFVWSSLSKTVV